MKKKLCCILILITFLLNSSIMLVISEAVDAVNQTKTEEDKIKALSEINLTKYENYDTTTENSESGSKGTLVQFNFKTGIEFAEDEEYKSIQKTETNIALPRIENYKPTRVEVIVKSTQATNGGREANYEYHSSTGILSIIAENSDYSQKVDNARDEYEIICIYGKECYTDNEERNFKIKLNTYETLNDEEKTKISTEREEEYNCKDTIGGVITTEHETEDIYDGYIKANTLNNENKYETTYNETLKIMISNKDIAQKIEVKETSEESLYTETSIDKEQVLDKLGDKGSIDILDESQNIVKTINKDSETDENGKIVLTYKNRVQNLTIQLNNLEKEGVIEVKNTRVIEPTAEIIDNKIQTKIDIRGINKIETEEEKEEVVKYERKGQSNVQIKSAVSEINTKISNETLVNNTQNDVTLTVTLKTNEARYSLFKNPTISIEMPNEVNKISMGSPELMYDNEVFKIVSSNVSENTNGNQVINIQLQGEQTSYEQSSLVEGTNLRIPLTISLTKELENKVGIIKINYSNEVTATVENKEMEVTLLNKVVNVIPTVAQTTNVENNEIEQNATVYEKDGIKAEVIEEVGNTTLGNNSTIYEQQIVKQSLKVTNNSNTSKKVSLVVNVPEEMTYVKLKAGGYIKNENKGYYVYSDQYEYEEQSEKQVTIDVEVKAGETKTEFIELNVKSLTNSDQEKKINIISNLQIDKSNVKQISMSHTVKKAKISVNLKCILGIKTRKEWVYKVQIENLSGEELKNINISFEASPFFCIDNVISDKSKRENIGKITENRWTYTIDTLKPVEKDENGRYTEGYIECYIDGQIGDIDESQYCGYELIGNAKVYSDDIPEYITNESRVTGYLEAVEITMESDKEILKKDDEITYTVNIKNVGKTFGGFSTYTDVNIKDVIPRELSPISVEYNDFEINKEIISDEEFPDLKQEVQTYTEKQKTQDLTTLDIPEDYDETDAPNIDLNLNIPEGKTVTLVIKAKAKMLSEKTEITNNITATGDYIKTKTTTVKTTIMNYDYVEPSENPDTPDNPSTPDNPENPDTPTNPDDSTEPTETKISISGTAWIDENEDGKRTTDEKTYSDMTVMLYDYKNNTFVKENGENKKVQTNKNGEYEFDDLKKGEYIVVFLYDTSAYKLTDYQKEEVIESKNNDAITKTIGINGEAVVAGLTDKLTAEGNLKNIDIGLIENKNFDLELNKYISKITIQTNDGKTKTYTYDNKQFAKVEIHSKKINGATVVVEYKMVVTNKGEVPGAVAQIEDKLPNGLTFKSELNKDWYEKEGKLYTNSLSEKTINVGESQEISLVLTKEVSNNNVGTVTNTAAIGISNNNKAIEDTNTDNDSSNAQLIIGVSTGLIGWVGKTIGTLIVLTILAIMILKNRKILKEALFISVFAICLIGNTQKVFGATFGHPDENIYIHGVFSGPTTMAYAVGTDGYTYYCVDHGLYFCESNHGASLYNTSKEKGQKRWNSVNANITLTDKTEHENVMISNYNDDFNKIGPFKIKCNKSGAKKKVTVTYRNSRLESKTVTITSETDMQLIGFEWDSNFYIKIPKDVVKIEKINVKATYSVTQTGTVPVTYTYTYNTWQIEGDNCRASGTTQDMQRQESGSEPITRIVNRSKEIEIEGPWISTGDIQIDKVDSNNTNTKLKNVAFRVQEGNSENKYMTIYNARDQRIDQIEVGTIDISNNAIVDNNKRSATIDSVTGYKVQFSSNASNATKIITKDSGSIIIKNLKYGNYTFTEVSNTNYGYTKMVSATGKIDSPLKKDKVLVKNEKKVGELNIDKADDRNTNKKLSGVEFVIQSSLNGQYIKIKSSGVWQSKITGTAIIDDTSDVVNDSSIQYTSDINKATKFVTDANGKLSVKNLLLSSDGSNEIQYNLIETYIPNPLYESTYQSGYISLSTSTQQALNHQVYIYLEGYVWEEIATSKNNFTNNLYNNTDALIEGIEVKLYKNGVLVATTKTNADGKYNFEKVKIDELDQYHVEFEYDGLRFTNVQADTDYSSKNYSITSKAIEQYEKREDNKSRLNVNLDFSEIVNGKSRKWGEEVYTLEYQYDKENHTSTYKDHWGYEYNEDKTKLKVTPSDDYPIVASTKTAGFDLKSAWEAQCKGIGAETLAGLNLGLQRREQADLAISNDISSVDMIVQNYENTYTYENKKEYEEQNPNADNYDATKDGFGTEVKFGNKYTTSYSNRGLNMYTRRIYESDLAKYNQNYESNKDLIQMYITYKITVKNQSNGIIVEANELSNYYDSRYEIVDSWVIKDNTTKNVGKNAWKSISKYGDSYNENGYKAAYTQATYYMRIEPNGKIEVYIKFKLKPEAVKSLIEKQTTLNNVSEITSFTGTESRPDGTMAAYACIDEDSNPGSVTSIKLDEDKTTKTTLNGREYEIENKTLNKDLFEDDTDMAPSLVLGIEEAEPTRGLTGTVFEDEDALHNDDNTHPGEERLGDGILHTGGEYRGKGKYGKIDANRISGAKVELLEYDSQGNTKVATLYKLKVNESGVMITTTEEAVTSTDSKGEYVFTGVIPGRYLIRYTYGNNCYIMNSAGEQIEQINALDYKSTTITSDIMKVALNLNKKYSSANEREGDLNWILKYDSTPDNDNYTTDTKSKSKDLSGLIRYSGATDDIDKREKSDDLYNGLYKNDFEMTADTAFFDVGVEYSEVKELDGFANRISYTNYTDEYRLEGDKILVLDENGRIKIADTFYAVNPYQDFGIIERARQDYDTNKRISNLKVTLANGQILINGNPYKQLPEDVTNIDEYWNNLESASENPLPYVKALPGQVVAEIDNEILQGATLNVEYTISIRNKSEMDYLYKNNQDYYYYGKNGQEKNNTAIRKVVDYMDDSLSYDDQRNSSMGWQKVNASDLYNWTKDQDNNSKQLITEDVKKAVEKGGYVVAVTEYFYQSGQNIEPGSIGSVKIYGSKVLSTSEKGISVENHAEIIETMGVRTIRNSTPGNYNPSTRKPDEPDDDMTSLVITPPTGLTDNKIFIISLSLIIFITLAGGVYFIKKKVL